MFLNANNEIRKRMILIGQWLMGTLTFLSESNDDEQLLEALQNWLCIQMQKVDPLMMGEIKCNHCSYKWAVALYRNSSETVKCPKCGAIDTKIIK